MRVQIGFVMRRTRQWAIDKYSTTGLRNRQVTQYCSEIGRTGPNTQLTAKTPGVEGRINASLLKLGPVVRFTGPSTAPPFAKLRVRDIECTYVCQKTACMCLRTSQCR